jgi:hypothetical protein
MVCRPLGHHRHELAGHEPLRRKYQTLLLREAEPFGFALFFAYPRFSRPNSAMITRLWSAWAKIGSRRLPET